MSRLDRKDKRFFDFMCSCKEEDKKQCDDIYDEVRVDLGRDGEPVTDRDFTTYLVYALQYLDNGVANIEHIYTDQWSGIAVKYQYDYKEGSEAKWETRDFWVECDRIHHGLARIYQLVRDFDSSVGV